MPASASALPHGFSIFQPALGAQLEFFPAVGTQELDELIHAHLPGPASSQEKRATVALNFLEHTHLTGQLFKFYPVYVAAMSPVTSASSSFETSPSTTVWDWNQTSRAASVSSRSSQNRMSKPASPASRMKRSTDLSNLPGMKIMTKDGVDVTNSATRGSKTKEQRDHAHLMRIIKACDNCKRKKTRCDPSHKKRSAPTSQATTPAALDKVVKKLRTASPLPSNSSHSSVSPPSLGDEAANVMSSLFNLDGLFSFDSLDTAASAPLTDANWDEFSLIGVNESWDKFIPYPAMGELEDYNVFSDPASLLSSSDSRLLATSLCDSAWLGCAGTQRGCGPGDGYVQSLEGELAVNLVDDSVGVGRGLCMPPRRRPDPSESKGVIDKYEASGVAEMATRASCVERSAMSGDRWTSVTAGDMVLLMQSVITHTLFAVLADWMSLNKVSSTQPRSNKRSYYRSACLASASVCSRGAKMTTFAQAAMVMC